MEIATTLQSDVAPLRRLVVKHARDAFVDQETIDREWRALNFTAAPDFARACDEYDRFLELVARSGADVVRMPRRNTVTIDSIYVRDASVVCDRGVILARMGKPLRAEEPLAQEALFRDIDVPIIGAIQAPGRLEGGDVVWLDPRTIVVGQGYRTNAEGIRQLRRLLGDSVDELIAVPLPHWRGAGDVLHLMSLISPVDANLAVVYSRLLTVEFREWLLNRGYALVEVPDDEFETMGTNVLALGPRVALMLSGNKRTRAALEQAGTEVVEYDGHEISVKGAGGPTCLTRPLTRQIERMSRGGT